MVPKAQTWHRWIAGLLTFLGMVILRDSIVESVVFDKKKGIVMLRRTNMAMYSKTTIHNLEDIDEVYAAKRGYNTKDMDITHFAIMIEFRREEYDPYGESPEPKIVRNRLQVMQSGNSKRVRKELLTLRKFLGFGVDKELQVLEIIDESKMARKKAKEEKEKKALEAQEDTSKQA